MNRSTLLKNVASFAALGATVAMPMAGDAEADDPAMAALATSLLAQAQSGQLDRTLFTDKMNDGLTSEKVASVAQQLASLGKPTKMSFAKHSTVDGFSVYEYLIVWPTISMNEQFALDGSGKIAGWFFKPATAVQTSTTADPAMDALAASLLAQAQSGQIDRTRMSGKMNDALTPAMVTSVAQQLGTLGKPASITFIKHVTVGGYSTYEYVVAWPSVSLSEQFSFDADGKIAGWFFKPTT
jgi:hypothetical protein